MTVSQMSEAALSKRGLVLDRPDPDGSTHFLAAADVDQHPHSGARTTLPAGSKADGAHCVAFSKAQRKGLVAILQNAGDGDAYAQCV